MNKINNILLGFIPKHTSCSFEEAKRQFIRDKEKVNIIEQIEKVENPLEVVINTTFKKKDPDMSVCNICKEVIYSSQYVLRITLNDENIELNKPVKLCEPCYYSYDK
jgi:hypothetical protein